MSARRMCVCIEIPDALIQKGLRHQALCPTCDPRNTRCPDSKGIKTKTIRRRCGTYRNTRCPDSKGIKTNLCILVGNQCWNTRCPDSKGIKTPFRLAWWKRQRNTRCPDSKGIKTRCRRCSGTQSGNTRCPDSKGIKTMNEASCVERQEIPDALIQKGLRRFARHFTDALQKYQMPWFKRD